MSKNATKLMVCFFRSQENRDQQGDKGPRESHEVPSSGEAASSAAAQPETETSVVQHETSVIPKFTELDAQQT